MLGRVASVVLPRVLRASRLRWRLLQELSPLVASDGEPRFLVRTDDIEIGKVTYRDGGYYADHIAWCVERVGGLDGLVFVDVGANIGTTTVPAVATHGASRAVAFEPANGNARILRANVVLNGLDEQVEVVEAAVSDHVGSVDMELDARNHGDHRVRVSTSDGAFAEASRATLTVPVTTIDDALATRCIDPDAVVMWVDAQGHEGHILSGASSVLHRPWVVEYWPYGLRRAGGFERFHDLLAGFSTVIDVRRSLATATTVAFAGGYDGTDHTDLVLLP